MQIVTLAVSPNEPCYGLYDGPDDGRWVQKVFVIRGDAIARYEVDLGHEEDFAQVTPMMIPSAGENSVEELQHLAEKNRHDDYWSKRAEQMLAESTLIADHVRQAEMDWLAVRNRSVFGPAVTVQRNAYDSTVAARKLSAGYQGATGIIPKRGRM